MKNKRNQDLEILKIEDSFNNKISELAIVNAKEQELLPEHINSLQREVKNKIQVDINELSQFATNLIKQDDKLTDEEVAIEMLKNISNNNKSKFMRKLASKMIKEKWWEK